MHTSVIEVAAPAWPVPVEEPRYAKELRRVAIPVEASDASWSAIKGTWEVGTQVVMLNDAMKIAEELQSRADMLARRVAELERENASLHREKMRLQDEVDEARDKLATAEAELEKIWEFSIDSAGRSGGGSALDEVGNAIATHRQRADKAEAEAAAIREAIHYKEKSGLHSIYSFIKQHTSDFKAFGNSPEVISWASKLIARIDAALSGTAGCELLELHAKEIAAKDAEIGDLRALLNRVAKACQKEPAMQKYQELGIDVLDAINGIPRANSYDPKCEMCNDTGEVITNEQHPNGSYIHAVCECKAKPKSDDAALLRARG
jgi:vacuolar-type H+-ATPase subunit I/STV1